jgi:ribosomal protein L37AE/L43A
MPGNLTAEQNKARQTRVQALLKQGATHRQIAAALGIMPATLREWMGIHGLTHRRRAEPLVAKHAVRPDIEAAKTAPRMERVCSQCGRKFLSQKADGAWLRFCDNCRRAIAGGVVFHGIAHDGRKGRAR